MKNPFDIYASSLPQILTQAVENAASDAISMIKTRVKKGVSSDGSDFSSPYSLSHAKRRGDEGLQTSRKDLHFSGTLFDNLTEVSRSVTESKATITVAFKGHANRGSHQNSATNSQVAKWLSEQEGDKSIIGLTKKEKDEISNNVARNIVDFIDKIEIYD